jgi:hypothetical protein
MRLAALRKSRGVSLDSIARETKIASYYLQAIEDLDFAKLPGGVYRRNFLTQYARSIDEDLAEDLHRILSTAEREEVEGKTSPGGCGITRLFRKELARQHRSNEILGARFDSCAEAVPQDHNLASTNQRKA